MIRKRRATIRDLHPSSAIGKRPLQYTSTYSSRLNVNFYASCPHCKYLADIYEGRARAKSSFIHRSVERECDAQFHC